MTDCLSTSRLEAFSDGVMAVIITIMVLELKVPATHEMSDRAALLLDAKIGVVYLLSFVQVGIYWVNHHYLLDDLETVSHPVLWANLAIMFGLSFLPFGLEWIGLRGVRPVPVAVYASCFLMPAIGWTFLSKAVSHRTHMAPPAGVAKQVFSGVTTFAAIFVSFLSPWAALAMIAIVLTVWLVPPRRIVEKTRALELERTRVHSSS